MQYNAIITGGSGLLGLNILLDEPPMYKFHAVVHQRKLHLDNANFISIDLQNLNSIEEALKLYSPKVVIHAAGMTDVDGCEKDPESAKLINGKLPGNIAHVCSNLDIKFVHISTDHLFDGKVKFVSEETSPNPINAYGYSKALGEEEVIKNNSRSLIIRSNFFTWGPVYRPSFSDFIHNNITNAQSINLAHDVYFTPILAQNLIETIFMLIKKDASGIYNVVGSERLSKYDFGIKMARIFSYDNELINKVSWSSIGAKAIRPADMSLSDKKIRNFLGHDLGTVDKNINDLKELKKTNLFNKVKNI